MALPCRNFTCVKTWAHSMQSPSLYSDSKSIPFRHEPNDSSSQLVNKVAAMYFIEIISVPLSLLLDLEVSRIAHLNGKCISLSQTPDKNLSLNVFVKIAKAEGP